MYQTSHANTGEKASLVHAKGVYRIDLDTCDIRKIGVIDGYPARCRITERYTPQNVGGGIHGRPRSSCRTCGPRFSDIASRPRITCVSCRSCRPCTTSRTRTPCWTGHSGSARITRWACRPGPPCRTRHAVDTGRPDTTEWCEMDIADRRPRITYRYVQIEGCAVAPKSAENGCRILVVNHCVTVILYSELCGRRICADATHVHAVLHNVQVARRSAQVAELYIGVRRGKGRILTESCGTGACRLCRLKGDEGPLTIPLYGVGVRIPRLYSS